ncbi:MAG TPA: GspMb/PilO family protein [Verrucomicrobiae bacterium]|nr:GspMb/PilO family protein [Verrucomicrobiae bacterium]
MTTGHNSPSWKKWIGIALAVPLVLDLGLAVYLWQGGRGNPREIRAEAGRLATQAKLLRADVDRGEKIRASLPQVGKDADSFYKDSFLDTSSGYSRIESDLGAIAAQAGVRTSGFAFKQAKTKQPGVTQISVTTSLQADYPAIVKFINGIERSKNFYLLDQMQINSVSTGGLNLQLELHAFFRT